MRYGKGEYKFNIIKSLKKVFKMVRAVNSDFECLITGSPHNLHKHHVFGGAYRQKSERYKFYIYLIGELHNLTSEGVHFDREFDLALKRKHQQQFEYSHTREEFIAEFGMSYIMDDMLDYEDELKKFIDRKRAKLGIYI